MSIILRSSLAQNAAQKRIMQEQYKEVIALRNSSLPMVEDYLALTINQDLRGNQGLSPADAYREMDTLTKLDQIPVGEHETLRRLLMVSRPVNIGREVFEYRQSTTAGIGQTSMSGQIGVKGDHVDYTYAGTVVPVHDTGITREWRSVAAMNADDFDALIDDAREADRTLLSTMDTYLWDGDANLSLKGREWLGIKNDPSVASATLAADLSIAGTTADAIRAEVQRLRDILRITNNCSGMLCVGVSREIYSNWERPFSTSEGTFGTILDYILKLNGIKEIYEDSKLSGNELTMYWADQSGFHSVIGMGLSTYGVPRINHNDPYNFIKWAAAGFLAKTDAAGRKCALFAS